MSHLLPVTYAIPTTERTPHSGSASCVLPGHQGLEASSQGQSSVCCRPQVHICAGGTGRPPCVQALDRCCLRESELGHIYVSCLSGKQVVLVTAGVQDGGDATRSTISPSDSQDTHTRYVRAAAHRTIRMSHWLRPAQASRLSNTHASYLRSACLQHRVIILPLGGCCCILPGVPTSSEE